MRAGGRGKKFEWDERRERRIRAMVADGAPRADIARAFGVSTSVIDVKLADLGVGVRRSASTAQRKTGT